MGALLALGMLPAVPPSHPPSGAVVEEAALATQNLTVSEVATPTSGSAPLTVHFVAEVSGAAGANPVVTWSFGDGGGGTGAEINYTYERGGAYSANVTVEDAAGRFANASVPITVSPIATDGGSSDGPAPLPWYLVDSAAVLAGIAVGAFGYRTLVARRSTQPPPANQEPAGPEGGRHPAGSAPPSIRVTPAGSTAPPMPTGLGPGPSPARAPQSPESSGEIGPTSSRSATDQERQRLSERVITHLLWYGRPTTEGIARSEATQQGMARLLNAGQNSVSKVLLRLEAGGIVRVQTEHVPGAPRRVKTYTLTPRGEAVARAIERQSGRRGPPS